MSGGAPSALAGPEEPAAGAARCWPAWPPAYQDRVAALLGDPAALRSGCEGWLQWPPAYQDRVAMLRAHLDGLETLLRPLREAHRAFMRLGGDLPPPVSRTWVLPAGATLVVRAGFSLEAGVGEIGRGVIPPPDPVACLASALCDADRWRSAMAEFASAAQWATQQAAEWHVTVPGFD